MLLQISEVQCKESRKLKLHCSELPSSLALGLPDYLRVCVCAGAWQAVWPEEVDEVRAAGGRRGGGQEAAQVPNCLHSQHGISLLHPALCTFPTAHSPVSTPRFPDRPEPPLSLANIVPASPLPQHNGFSHSEPASR